MSTSARMLDHLVLSLSAIIIIHDFFDCIHRIHSLNDFVFVDKLMSNFEILSKREIEKQHCFVQIHGRPKYFVLIYTNYLVLLRLFLKIAK